MRFFTFIIALLALLPTYGQQRLSLSEAANLAIENNPAIKATDHALRAAQRQRQAAIGLYLPQIAVNSGWIRTQKDIGFDLNPLKPLFSELNIAPLLGLDWSYTLQPRSFGFIEADITVPIFTGGKIVAANRAAKASERAAYSQNIARTDKVVTELITRYFGSVLAANSVKVRELLLRSIEQHLSDIIALTDAGMATKADKLYVEFALEDARQQLSAARSQFAIAQRALSTTIGTATTIQTTSDIFIVATIEELDHFKSAALTNNSQLRYITEQRELAKQNVNLKRADFFPEIVAMGGGGFTRNITELLPRWAIGIGLSFKLFNGTTREYNYLAAKDIYRQAEEISISAEQNITLLVEQLYSQTITHLNRVIALNSSISFAEQYLENKRVAFAQSMASSADVIDATLLVAKSHIEQLEAAYNFDISLAQLLETAGESYRFFDYSESKNRQIIEYEVR